MTAKKTTQLEDAKKLKAALWLLAHTRDRLMVMGESLEERPPEEFGLAVGYAQGCTRILIDDLNRFLGDEAGYE